MLTIAVPRERVPDLSRDGHKCKINGHQTTLRLADGYLTYEDEQGVLNRCKILSSQPDDGVVHYMAASHGDESKSHHITRLDHTGQPVSVMDDVSATSVIVSINGKTVAKGSFPHGDIDGLLAMGDKHAVEAWGGERPWERAIYGIVTMVERGEIDLKAIIATGVWAVCRRDDDPNGATAVEDIAREGGNTIAVEIKTDAVGFEFRGRGYPTPRAVSREQARRLRQMGSARLHKESSMATSLLIDAVDRNAQHPDTFEIPPHHERSALKVGQCAKIGVEFPGNEGRIAGERFWVEVVESSPPVFVGRVVNDLVHTREHGFTRSDRIEFAEFNVLALE